MVTKGESKEKTECVLTTAQNNTIKIIYIKEKLIIRGILASRGYGVIEMKHCELNYHDQKIQQTLTRDIRKHWSW